MTISGHCRLALFFILCLSAITPAQSGDDEIIKVDSSVVLMNAVITDSEGKPVSGLRKTQFKVFEDGIEQEVSIFETQETPFAAVILLDTSGSMEQRISLARSAAINFLDGLRPDDNTAIYNFDTKVSLIQDFSNSRDVAEKVFDLKSYGYTALNDAIYKAAQELSNRPEKRRAIIVLSDGADNKSRYSSDKALKAANIAGATVYTVDMSAIDMNGRERMQSQSALKNFAEKTGGVFIPTPGGNALRQAFKNIVAELGVQYTLGYQSSNSKKDGKWRAIELKVARPSLMIRTRKGYHAEKERK
jgi:Ca-activated chloride channel family protein